MWWKQTKATQIEKDTFNILKVLSYITASPKWEPVNMKERYMYNIINTHIPMEHKQSRMASASFIGASKHTN
jgi:hypothetical protein